MVAAVVFDMDGTLVDTEHIHFDAWNEIFTNFGVGPFPQEWFGKWVGRSAPSLGAQMLEDYPTEITISAAELVEQKEAAFTRMARDPDGPMQSVVFEGLADSLKALGDHHVPIALCTSAFRVSSTAVLEGTQLAQFFSADRRTTIDDVENAKPDPEPYRRAAGTVSAPTEDCVALEDSASGVASAVAAGYGCVLGVLTTSPEASLRGAGAHHTFAGTVDAIDFILREGRNKSAAALAAAASSKL